MKWLDSGWHTLYPGKKFVDIPLTERKNNFFRGQHDPKKTVQEHAETFPDLHAGVMALFDDLMYPGDVFVSNPDVNKIYDMFALATRPDYRGQGVASKLVKHALVVARMAGCEAVTVLATNDISRKIFDKMGMTVLGTKHWSEVVLNGKCVFGEVESEMASAHILKL